MLHQERQLSNTMLSSKGVKINSGPNTRRLNNQKQMLTTVIGAYPKPDYLKITDWFNAKGGTDTATPTKLYEDEIKKMGADAE